MYFKLDKTDVIYDEDNNPMYQMIAVEEFKALLVDSHGMICHVAAIPEGTKGGYAGSIFCMEKIFDLDVNPWVMFPASISAGCILSGMSLISGNARISKKSIVESGCIIEDSFVSGSHIKTYRAAVKNNKALASVLVTGGSEITESNITGDNIKVYKSHMEECSMEHGDNISIFNSELYNLCLCKNVGIKNTVLMGNGSLAVKEETIYHAGLRTSGIPENMMVKIGERFCTHKEAYEIFCGNTDLMSGTYQKYRPVYGGGDCYGSNYRESE